MKTKRLALSFMAAVAIAHAQAVVPQIVASGSFLNQASSNVTPYESIPVTDLFTPKSDGLFRITFVCDASSTQDLVFPCGAVEGNPIWTDKSGRRDVHPFFLSQNSSFLFRTSAGMPVSFHSFTFGGGFIYDLYWIIERL